LTFIFANSLKVHPVNCPVYSTAISVTKTTDSMAKKGSFIFQVNPIDLCYARY
jgi:hypothetical protein